MPLAVRIRQSAPANSGAPANAKGWLAAVIASLRSGVCTEADLIDFSLDYGGPIGAAYVMNLIQDLHAAGALSFALHDRGKFLAECHGDFANTTFARLRESLVMSAYATFRASPAGILVTSATLCNEVTICNRVARQLMDVRLSQGAWLVCDAINWLRESPVDFSDESLCGLISLLLRAEVFLPARGERLEEDNGTRMWEFHDLLFHTRTTQGHGLAKPQGATYRFCGEVRPEPASRLHEWPHYKTLDRPDGRDFAMPFWEVLQSRRSPPSSTPCLEDIELFDLERFLSCLMVTEPPSHLGSGYEVTRRLYPGAGACYELEVFPLIIRCVGIERGLYYYDAGGNSLYRVSGWQPELEELAASAGRATGRISAPAAVLLLSARIERLTWKYEGIAYALCLKDVGVLFDFMYFIGAALGVEVCALGSVEAGVFSRITGAELLREPLVGQFMIVGRRTDDC